MAIVKVTENKSFALDNVFCRELNILLDCMKQNDDLVLIFSGEERSGKSHFAFQVAKYCANYLGSNFDNSNISMDLISYVDKSIENYKNKGFYQINLLDESRDALNRKKSMTKAVVKFTSYLSECGKFRQVHIICLPAYHDLDRYIVNWRTKGVIRVIKNIVKVETNELEQFPSGYKLDRGLFLFYPNNEDLKVMYDIPYKYPKQYGVKGHFSFCEVIDMVEYEKLKDLSLEKYYSKNQEEKLGKNEKKWKEYTIKLCRAMREYKNISVSELAHYLGIEKTHLYSYMQLEKTEDKEQNML